MNAIYPILSIPQYTTDPVSPSEEDMWVKATISGGSGGGILQAISGLGFPILTKNSGGSQQYELSYRTKEGTTVRTTLS